MLKKYQLLFFILILNFSFITKPLHDDTKTVLKWVAGIHYLLLGKPLFNGLEQEEIAANLLKLEESIKLKKDQIQKVLIDFFSNQHDGLIAINKLNDNQNDEELLKTYLKVASSRMEYLANQNFATCKSILKSWAILSFLCFCVDIYGFGF